MKTNKKCIVLLSGGLDSATTLAIAADQGFECYALSFDYGQRHHPELLAARRIAKALNVKQHKFITIDLKQFGGSALTDNNLAVPERHTEGIPITYVPARNTIFLSYALAWAEVLGANDIFTGMNAIDYSGYPDCRPEYVSAYEAMANLATKTAVEGNKLRIHTPLIDLRKAEIIKIGARLNVDYSLTVSCYRADEQGRACDKCESCLFRKEGFEAAGINDPTHYQ